VETARGRDMDNREKKESINEPATPEETLALHKILRSDPQRYLRIVDEWLAENPANSHAYFDRHFVWMKIGEPRRALEDLDKVVELNPDTAAFFSRGLVHRHLGQYEQALEDFDRGEAINPKRWEDDVFGLFYQADTHARLGNESAALACCARLPDDFWTPGVYGAPGGSKGDVAEKLRRIAADARRKRLSP
jgi:tetratricopeptide (TPR) repeat protein